MNSTQATERRQGANSIAEDLERKIRAGQIAEGDRLPSIRGLAEELDLSPATVAAAYQRLRSRGLVVATKRGTVVAPKPELPVRSSASTQSVGRDVSDGNPDLRLLPDLGQLDPTAVPIQYGESQNVKALVDLGREMFEIDGVPASHLAIVGGSHDAVERALAAHLLPGDSVAVEDPGYAGTHDLVRAMGLVGYPIPIDDEGLRPESLNQALARGVSAVVLTNRAQNPTGAALSETRARQLATILDRYPEVLVIEDDHAGPVCGAPFFTTVTEDRHRWIVVRSFGKYLSPDLRVAVMVGDSLTVHRVQSKQLVGTGWVSQMLQHLVVRGLSDPRCIAALEAAEESYRQRRERLLQELSSRGVSASAPSGFNVWIPVERETEVWGRLRDAGWVAAPGEAFRIESGPAIRVTISQLDLEDLAPLADDLVRAVSGRSAPTA